MSKKVFFVHFETKIGNAENIFLSVAKFCHGSQRTVRAGWQSSAARVGELCYCSSTALLRQRENFATVVALHCCTQKRGLCSMTCTIPPMCRRLFYFATFFSRMTRLANWRLSVASMPVSIRNLPEKVLPSKGWLRSAHSNSFRR